MTPGPPVPIITIIRCIKCHTHQWCTRHIETDYINKAAALKACIEEVLPAGEFFIAVNDVHQKFAKNEYIEYRSFAREISR
jgi:hypothetical protein